MIVRVIVEAFEPEQLPLDAVHGAEDLHADALVGVVAAAAPAMRRAPVDVAILQ